MQFDLYEELGVNKNCTIDEIKQAYKKLALKWHPDKNKGNEEAATQKFQRISESYSILSDPEKKARYDKYGTINDDDFDFQDFMAHMDFGDLLGTLIGDLKFSFNIPKNMGGRRKQKHVSKAQMRKEQRMAEKLMKEMMGNNEFSDDDDEDDDSTEQKTKKKNLKQDDDDGWETEEEEEIDGPNAKKKAENVEGDDDDFEDIDSEEEREEEKKKNKNKKKQKKDESDDEFDEMDQMQEMLLFPVFVEEHTERKGKNLKCKFDNKVYKNDDDLFEHFTENHRNQFKPWLDKQIEEDEVQDKKNLKKGGPGIKFSFM